MSGLIAPLAACFVLWSVYAIPGEAAGKVHGASVNLLFETCAFIGITFLMSGKIIADWPKVTLVSGAQASLMGLGSAVGFYFFLQAMNAAPSGLGLALVLLVAGITFPTQGALAGLLAEGVAPHQWLAIAGMAGCVVLFNWKF